MDKLRELAAAALLPGFSGTTSVPAAGLGGPVPTPRARLDSTLGLFAAREAVRAYTLPPLPGRPLVVDIPVAPNIPVGDVPWGLGPHPAGLVPGVSTLRVVTMSTASVSAAEILNTASSRPLVLVTRDAHRYPRKTTHHA